MYVGIDIFGRNCFGGGGFNTAAAVMVARELRLSVALFAIGWVYECHPLDQFAALSSKFWSALLPHFGLRNTISSLPIRTSFCPGFGKAVYSKGQVIILLIFISIKYLSVLFIDYSRGTLAQYFQTGIAADARRCRWT